MRVRFYRYRDNPSKTPHRYVSKSTATRWFTWGIVNWIGKCAIQERYKDPFRAIAGRIIPPARIRYSPDKMPPLELPQTRFIEPDSPAWREIHRKVNLPAS